MTDFHTFSIVARCPRTGDFGVAVSTARLAVGAVVPWASAHGAVATQARSNTELGRGALALMEQGVPVSDALQALVADDPDRAQRQVHGIDAIGSWAHTGDECETWCGHEVGAHWSVAGNMLAGPEVIQEMSRAFQSAADEDLSDRLVRALEAGQAAGGDKRGKQSAALLIASSIPLPTHNLRVDDHPDPIAELRRLHTLAIDFAHALRDQYGPDHLRRYRRTKL